MVHPVTLEREFNIISEEREIGIGRGAHTEIIKNFGYYQDDQLQRYVYQVGQKLVAVCPRHDISYHFTVIDSDIENAFATPGGYIYISRGLLAIMNSEAELAGVLGHEIGHVAGRDSAALMSQGMLAQIATLAGAAGAAASSGASGGDLAMATNQLFNAIMLGFSREREYLADDQSIEYITACGYDPTQMLQFMRTLSQKSQGPTGVQQYLVTHPYIFDRMAHIEAKIKVLRTMRDTMNQIRNAPAEARASGITEAGRYKQMLDGLAYGPKDQVRRIKLYIVQPGDSLELIARTTLGSALKARELAYINGTQPGTQLVPGATIKTIY